MKDWEITEAYFLPRILCWRTRNNTLPGKLPKPNLRFFSLSEDNQWTAWKSSDYFYPEMIPEPDYSDSGDDSGPDKDAYCTDQRSTIERLRDLTEVYVSNVNTKTTAGSDSKSASKQPPGQKKEVAKARKQPTKSPPKPPEQKRSKSPTKSTKQSETTSTSKRSKSPEDTKKTIPKRKASPKRKIEPPTTTNKSQPDSSGDAKISKAKPEAAKKKTSPKTKTAAAATTKAAGDAKTKATSDFGDKTPLSSLPTSGPSQSSEGSSDEEQLIKPRKPYVASTEIQKLHKELKFSQKYGNRLSSSKTELQLALERYTENKVKRELDAEEKSSLEKILEYQAKKIEMQETMDKSPAWLERLQRPPSTWADPKTEEFYRVHAKVVSSSILTNCFLTDEEQSASPECSSSRTSPNSDSSSDS